MRYALWISLVIALLAVTFALQNLTPVVVRIGPAEFEGSLALILIITLVIGVLIGYLATLGRRMKAGWKIFRLKRDLDHQRGEPKVPMTPPPGPIPAPPPQSPSKSAPPPENLSSPSDNPPPPSDNPSRQ